MEKGYRSVVVSNIMDLETILLLKEQFQNFIDQKPHLKHFSFEEFLEIADHCNGLYSLISGGKIKIQTRPVPETEPFPHENDEEPEICSSCQNPHRIPHLFCFLPSGICKILSRPNRLRKFDLKGRSRQ